MNPQPAAQRVTVFYDGACPLCSREIAHYRKLDRDAAIDWQDIGYSASPLDGTGIDHEAALTRLHVLGPQGELHQGAGAFLLIWRQLPRWRWLARMVSTLRLQPLLGWGYEFWVRHRSRPARCTTDGSCR